MSDSTDTRSMLEDVAVATFESRLSETTADLVRKYGGRPVPAPTMQEVPLDDHRAVFDFGEELFEGRIDVVVFNTGVGADMLVETLETEHSTEEIVEALSAARVVARGPKPVAALGEWGVSVDHRVPEPNTWREILELFDGTDALSPPAAGRVAVQEYGKKNEELLQGLRERGLETIRVPIYRWELPDDLQPLRDAIARVAAGEVEVAVFTSRHQVDHLLEVARREDREAELREALEDVLVASVGPVTSRRLIELGIDVGLEPDRPKLGVLMRELASHFAHEYDE